MSTRYTYNRDGGNSYKVVRLFPDYQLIRPWADHLIKVSRSLHHYPNCFLRSCLIWSLEHCYRGARNTLKKMSPIHLTWKIIICLITIVDGMYITPGVRYAHGP